MSCRGFDSIAPFRLVPLLAVSILLFGCSKSEPGPRPRYAFLAIENTSGDPALDWVSRGTSEFLSRSLHDAMGGTGSVITPDAIGRAGQTLSPTNPQAPGDSAARMAAIAAGANHVVTGYVEHTPSGIRITASDEDVSTHRTARTLAGTAPTAFEALTLVAREFSDHAAQGPTANAEAFRLYCLALQSAIATAPPLLEQAVALDPGFGRAWVALARTLLSAGKRDDATAAIAKANAQKIAGIDQAWLEFEASALSGNRTASLASMRKVSESEPGDTGLARNLAAAETNAGNFREAATVWKRLTVNSPGDIDAWNQLGYALCWSGDYQGALATLREYARLRPNDANPLDSEGDVHYWFGKFADAAASYAAAYARMPGFLNGGDLYKGAWAKFRAGDKAGADALFAKFREAREKAKDGSIDLFAGDWLYRTGRAKEARALLNTSLQQEVAGRPAALRSALATQLALWDLLDGDRAGALKDMTAGGAANFTPTDLALRFATTPSASAPEWAARAEHLMAAPQLSGIRETALGYALILDGKKQAAIPVWEKIAAQSPGADFFPRNILTRLRGQPLEHFSPPDSANFNPFLAVLDRL